MNRRIRAWCPKADRSHSPSLAVTWGQTESLKLYEIIILVLLASIGLLSALAIHAYIASFSEIHRIKLGDIIVYPFTFDGGFINNHTIAIGYSGVAGKSSVSIKIDKLPFSLQFYNQVVTVYNYGSDWLELSITLNSF